MSKKPVVLIDGSSYLYRAFHVPNLQRLSNSAGAPTGAVHGILNMTNRLLTDYDPEQIAVVFDAPGKTFRDDMYPEYKANRPPMPDELRSQIEPSLAAIEALGIKVIRIAGVEADDVIGTLATAASAEGLETVISTTDKDMTQLVDDNVLVLNTMDDRRLDAEGVTQRYGVAPSQIIDYLTLIGDSSDNIPGVPGVGPKTAQKWLAEYGDLDGVIAHADDIAGKAGENLRTALDSLPLYEALVTIKCDLELPFELDELRRRPVDNEKLRAVLEPLEMFNLLRRFLSLGETAPEPESGTSYEVVLTREALDRWIERIEAAPLTAFDTETTSLRYMEAELVGLSLGSDPLTAAYVPVAHAYVGAPEQLGRDEVLAALKPWLEDETKKKVGHHLKYDAHVLENYGIVLAGIEHDTMLESYVLNSTATRHDMDSVAARYLGITTTKYEDVTGKGAKQIGFADVEIERAGAYAAQDADVSLRLHRTLWPMLEAEPDLAGVYTEIERPLIHVLQRMEHTGVLVDARMLARQSNELAAAMQATEAAAFAEAGGEFMIGSPKQLQEVLFGKLGLPVLGKTPKGQPSTAENVLAELAEDYALPALILEYRALSKLKSTYTDKLPREINPRTGRIHTSYHQAIAATGRLSSSDPNLQNIPIRKAEGRRIRQAFIAPKGHVLIAADYSQIELRIMAHLSGDEGLIAAFREEQDVHRATAAEVFGVGTKDVDAEQRRSAKAINFGLIYGMSAYGLARQLGIGRQEAQQYVNLYFERYPGVKAFMDSTRELAREQGFVSTVFGRRLYLPDINARNRQRREYAERSAINAPMQGTAADIIKRAMLEVQSQIDDDGLPGRLIMQVHDELVLEVEEGAAEPAKERLAGIMQGAAELAVPLRVEAHQGANWDEAH
ncbi:MAG TPA: DNA polymerase I [Gammaproteobacteria bacterium]|nr:DNA polymerase I [Gammaproteobacteria bacterium]